MSSHQDQVEPVVHLLNAVFDGDAGHVRLQVNGGIKRPSYTSTPCRTSFSAV
jgi:hypothetical protein